MSGTILSIHLCLLCVCRNKFTFLLWQRFWTLKLVDPPSRSILLWNFHAGRRSCNKFQKEQVKKSAAAVAGFGISEKITILKDIRKKLIFENLIDSHLIQKHIPSACSYKIWSPEVHISATHRYRLLTLLITDRCWPSVSKWNKSFFYIDSL
jgi:hypothetical protein